jgi:protein involved in polysaccharide export with SLBB domain
MSVSMKRLICVLVALTTIIAMAFCQQAQTYRLQPEDVIRVQVFGLPDVAAEVPVGRDGNVTAPYIGILKASGKTATELEADLSREYVKKLRLKDPRVSVTIVRYRQIICSVGPAVNRPGPITLRPGDTILDLINGGSGVLLDNRSDLKRATLQRKSSKELIPIDLYSMLILGDL